ncbi:hypothetical protein F7725_015206 [Dissostichus mawsoni]|uniref:Carboxylesterase type B domain-containing protein n=1 Tax=Dissostichus mawsoni TaxID=36200 RepID=A0A7J5YIU6_DISMA|nr:hypothetical protein F7725_015206 [Dissostichus mawsoni]
MQKEGVQHSDFFLYIPLIESIRIYKLKMLIVCGEQSLPLAELDRLKDPARVRTAGSISFKQEAMPSSVGQLTFSNLGRTCVRGSGSALKVRQTSKNNPLTVNMMKMKMKSVVAIAVFLETVSAISLGLVNTEGGLVQGENIPLASGRHMDVFRGIPFADVPETFMKPKPHPGWEGVLDATAFKDICLQVHLAFNTTTGSTDCLYLNIWILQFTQFSGQELADRGNVIVVSIGYRVGSLGFLSTGEPELAGNYGLWDQQAAIAWVHRNIRKFGGDPDNITIFGEAIAQSGVALSPWTINKNPASCSAVNCSTDERMASCLKEIDPAVLTLAGSFNLSSSASARMWRSFWLRTRRIRATLLCRLHFHYITQPGNQRPARRTQENPHFLFLASTQAALKLHADNAKTGRTYSYLFSEPNQMAGIFRPYPRWMGADHTDDVPYVFGKPFTAPLMFPAKSHRDLSGYMIAYWTNFARTGTGQKFVELNSKMDESYVGENMRMPFVDLWNNVIPNLPNIIPNKAFGSLYFGSDRYTGSTMAVQSEGQ